MLVLVLLDLYQQETIEDHEMHSSSSLYLKIADRINAAKEKRTPYYCGGTTSVRTLGLPRMMTVYYKVLVDGLKFYLSWL